MAMGRKNDTKHDFHNWIEAHNTTKAAPIAKPYHSLNELLSIKKF
jgi:hypothetical protein